MGKENIKNKIKKLPSSPGVYFFMKGKKILYIGKATSLKDRVKSYFNGRIEEARGPLISKMLSQFNDIAFQKTDSVLEALILEASLIKKHQPEANTAEKDDKSFNYVVITDEDFPRVLVIRGRELEKNMSLSILKTFGPFTNGSQLKEAIKIVRKIFPFRDKCLPYLPRTGSGNTETARGGRDEVRVGCFNRQIGLCPGVCTGEISKKDYGKIVRNIILFFEGKKKVLLKNLEKQMKTFAKAKKFEEANKIKKTIFALNHIQDVALIKDRPMGIFGASEKFRIESYDIAHLSGTNMVGAMVVVEDGEIKKSDYRKFKIRGQKNADDTKALAEVLTRRLAHSEWPLPNLIVVDGGIAQKTIAEKVLQEKNFNIPVVSVVKDEHHKPREVLGLNPASAKATAGKEEILLANSEAHRFAIGFHKQLRRKMF